MMLEGMGYWASRNGRNERPEEGLANPQSGGTSHEQKCQGACDWTCTDPGPSSWSRAGRLLELGTRLRLGHDGAGNDGTRDDGGLVGLRAPRPNRAVGVGGTDHRWRGVVRSGAGARRGAGAGGGKGGGKGPLGILQRRGAARGGTQKQIKEK